MRFYDFFQGVCGKNHICRVSVHAAILKVTEVFEDVPVRIDMSINTL
jgi:hypothetical protein